MPRTWPWTSHATTNFDDDWILARRPPRHALSPERPYAWLNEQEPATDGRSGVVDVATIFLTNRECPYRCLMCDLWKNTLPTSVAPGDIPTQIRWALARLKPAQHLKLYNAGSFFDPQAIPAEDDADIARLAAPLSASSWSVIRVWSAGAASSFAGGSAASWKSRWDWRRCIRTCCPD